MYREILEFLYASHGPPTLDKNEWGFMCAIADNFDDLLQPRDKRQYQLLAARFELDPSHAKRLERATALLLGLLKRDQEAETHVMLNRELHNYHNPEWLAEALLSIAKVRHHLKPEESFTWDYLGRSVPCNWEQSP